MIRKVKTNYSDLSQPEFNDLLTDIIAKMTGNTNFPTPTVPITEIVSGQTDWNKERSKSKSGDHEATTKANTLHDDLVRKIKIDGDYINNTANGDVAKMETTGYILTKEHVYGPKPDVEFLQGKIDGECIVVIEAIPSAITYLCEIAADPCPAPDSPEWKRQKMSSKATITINNLAPRKLYWFRFCYLTVDGESSYSAPVSFSIK